MEKKDVERQNRHGSSQRNFSTGSGGISSSEAYISYLKENIKPQDFQWAKAWQEHVAQQKKESKRRQDHLDKQLNLWVSCVSCVTGLDL